MHAKITYGKVAVVPTTAVSISASISMRHRPTTARSNYDEYIFASGHSVVAVATLSEDPLQTCSTIAFAPRCCSHPPWHAPMLIAAGRLWSRQRT